MEALGAMIRKEFVHIGRDPQLIGFVLGLPILLLVLFGYALRPEGRPHAAGRVGLRHRRSSASP